MVFRPLGHSGNDQEFRRRGTTHILRRIDGLQYTAGDGGRVANAVSRRSHASNGLFLANPPCGNRARVAGRPACESGQHARISPILPKNCGLPRRFACLVFIGTGGLRCGNSKPQATEQLLGPVSSISICRCWFRADKPAEARYTGFVVRSRTRVFHRFFVRMRPTVQRGGKKSEL
jgi:hypothetical protein